MVAFIEYLELKMISFHFENQCFIFHKFSLFISFLCHSQYFILIEFALSEDTPRMFFSLICFHLSIHLP